MILAHHAFFGAYGFWLPNDPRGSWSDFVASWELRRFGQATGVHRRKSAAHGEHDEKLRLAAKAALKYPAVILSGIQARAVARGFAIACQKSNCKILACSILPEHVHLVVRRHEQHVERIVGHLKGRATQQLIEENLHPLGSFFTSNEIPLTPWEEKCWKVFLNDEYELRHAMQYVQQNPIKEGKRSQQWSFVESV